MDLNELKNSVQKLNDERVALVQAQGQAALGGAFKELFEKHETLESVTWAQYTPYFNDGDSCMFSVHGFRNAKTTDGEEHEEPSYGDKLSPAIVADLKAIENAIRGLGSTMELIFGDHKEITASRNGFSVDDCDHD